jgi:hypothetical protein
VLDTCEVNANSNFKVPGCLAWFGATQRSAIVVYLSGISSTSQHAFGVDQESAQKGTHESDQDKEWEGPLEIVSPPNRIAIRFALGDGDKRENGDGL